MAITLDAPSPAQPRANAAAVTPRGARAPFALGAVGVVVLAKLVLQLAVAGRYGWHRDELYYFEAGNHPALGYSDFPPVTPLLARLARALYGDSLIGLRSFAALAGAAVVVLVALAARELGGGRYAQVMAAVLAALGPWLLGSNAMFQTVSFDQLAWATLICLLGRLLARGEDRLWIAIGLVAGLGLMTKYTIAMLLVAVALGFALTAEGRRRLGTAGPWHAAGLAALLFLPNLWWQARHGWPSVDFFVGGGHDRSDTSPVEHIAELLLLAGPFVLPVCIAGVRMLACDPRFRPLAWVGPLVIAGFLVTGGKSYYAAPVLALLYAAGAVAIERAAGRARRWARVGVPAALTVTFAFVPLGLPVLPESTMVDLHLWEVREDYAEEIGWPELVTTVERAYESIPPSERGDTVILTTNYGEAGAVDRFGPARGLPAAVSGHLAYRYWTPDEALDSLTLVTVGYPRSWLDEQCIAVEHLELIRNHAGVENEEFGRPVAVCRLDGTLRDLWPELRRP